MVQLVFFFSTGRLLFAGYHDYTMNVWDTLKVGQLNFHVWNFHTRVDCVQSNNIIIANDLGSSLQKVWHTRNLLSYIEVTL